MYAEPADASVAAAAKAVVRCGKPTNASLGADSRVVGVATVDWASQCGIKSGIDFDSLIVELNERCQAKVRVPLQ